jgi:tRNA pseudouridine55 synthase
MNPLPPYFLVNKHQGETPLEALERLRAEKAISKDVPMTYAGRLDPMAEGLLLILVGEECKKKEQYLGLDKEYEVEVLLGVGSDTGDVLGKLKGKIQKAKVKVEKKKVEEVLKSLIGKRKEKYPAFSSRPVKGKPLFVHTREGNGDIEMPEKEIEIYSIELFDVREKSGDDLVKEAIERISKVKGDFRQKEIVDSWKALKIPQTFIIVKLKVRSSSGAYMRTLAERIGEKLDQPAVAWSIKRSKMGDYSL